MLYRLPIIDRVPGVPRDPAYVSSANHRASSVAGLDAIRNAVRI